MRSLALIFAFIPLQAAAQCPEGNTIFTCSAGKKTIEVCAENGNVTYNFGPRSRPEMTLTVSIKAADFTPWPGIGRTIWNSVAFHNQGYTYEVWASLEKMLEDEGPTPIPEGGVNVLKGEALQAQVTCNPGSVQTFLDLLYDQKTAAGQCWNYTTHAWQITPPAAAGQSEPPPCVSP